MTEAIENKDKELVSKRKEIKDLIKELKKVNPNVDKNIFSSIHNVNLSTVIGYTIDGKKVDFLDNY